MKGIGEKAPHRALSWERSVAAMSSSNFFSGGWGFLSLSGFSVPYSVDPLYIKSDIIMVTALIISVSIAIVFIALFFDERGSTLDYRREIKDQDEKIRRLEASAIQASPRNAEISLSVDDQDLWDITPDLVSDAVKFNGYVPSKDSDSVSFMVQGRRYFIATDRLPYLILVKQFSVNKEEHDIPAMREAAGEVIRHRILGKVSVSEEGDAISFYVGGIEPKYGHLRDVISEYIRIVSDLQSAFDETYNRILQDKEDMRRLEANGIPMEDPRPEGRKMLS